MTTSPSQKELLRELKAGYIWLRFDLFKESGKWGYGGYARLSLSVAKALQFESGAFLRYIQENQAECTCDFSQWNVVISEHHYNDIAEYTSFFTRLCKGAF